MPETDCGCRAIWRNFHQYDEKQGDGYYEIVYCPLHAAADEMLAALQRIVLRAVRAADGPAYVVPIDEIAMIKSIVAHATQEVKP